MEASPVMRTNSLQRADIRRGLLAMLCALVAACVTSEPAHSAAPDSFRFREWAGPSLNVYVYRPPSWTADAPVVFALHGINRAPQRMFARWRPLADRYGFLLVVPEFTESNFPGAGGYALGGLPEEGGAVEGGRALAFDAIDPIFSILHQRLKLTRTGFRLFGHSAGAQFVHRYLLFRPNARVERAVVSNAGWYTMPDADSPWPCGLRNTPLEPSNKASFFSRDVTVMLGARDIRGHAENLRHSSCAEAEGRNRLERGMAFFNRSRSAAAKARLPFQWGLMILPGVGHDSGKASAAAAPILGS